MNNRFTIAEEEKNRILDLHKVGGLDEQHEVTQTPNTVGPYISARAWAPDGSLTGQNVPEITGEEPEVVDATKTRKLKSTMSTSGLKVPVMGGVPDYDPHDDISPNKRGEVVKPLEKTPCCKKCKNGRFKRCGTKDIDCKYGTISDCQLKGKEGNMKSVKESLERIIKIIKS